MSRWAGLTEEHWRKYLPIAYADIADKCAFFAELDDAAETEIQTLADALAGPDEPGEEFMAKVGRLTSARHTAESQVVREMLLIEPEQPGR